MVRSLTLLALLAGLITGCESDTGSDRAGGGSGSESATQEETKKPAKEKAPQGPEGCLKAVGASNVEKRDTNFWRGINPDDGTILSIEKLESAAVAKQAVKDADLVHSASTGRWFIVGAAKSANDGELVRILGSCVGLK